MGAHRPETGSLRHTAGTGKTRLVSRALMADPAMLWREGAPGSLCEEKW